MSLSNPPKSPDTPDPDEVELCKGCNTMKHLDANGLCGRCQPDPKRTLDKENSYMGDITPDQDGLIEFLDDPETLKKAVEGSMDKRIAKLDQVDALDAILEDWFMKPKADLKAKLSALLVEARLDELNRLEAVYKRYEQGNFWEYAVWSGDIEKRQTELTQKPPQEAA